MCSRPCLEVASSAPISWLTEGIFRLSKVISAKCCLVGWPAYGQQAVWAAWDQNYCGFYHNWAGCNVHRAFKIVGDHCGLHCALMARKQVRAASDHFFVTSICKPYDAARGDLDDLLFEGASLSMLPAQPHLVINATELRTGSAFRFGTLELGSWRWGRLYRNDISIAHAVAASAAYPLFLPAFDETLTFEKGGELKWPRDSDRRWYL